MTDECVNPATLFPSTVKGTKLHDPLHYSPLTSHSSQLPADPVLRMLNARLGSTSICHNLHDDISLINLHTFIAFSNSNWFLNETWFPMPANFYRDSLLKSLDDKDRHEFEVKKDQYGKHQVGNYLDHYTKYNCNNRNLHKYKVIDFPIYAKDHFFNCFFGALFNFNC